MDKNTFEKNIYTFRSSSKNKYKGIDEKQYITKKSVYKK